MFLVPPQAGKEELYAPATKLISFYPNYKWEFPDFPPHRVPPSRRKNSQQVSKWNQGTFQNLEMRRFSSLECHALPPWPGLTLPWRSCRLTRSRGPRGYGAESAPTHAAMGLWRSVLFHSPCPEDRIVQNLSRGGFVVVVVLIFTKTPWVVAKGSA